jgi:hypothetical protein
MCAKKSPSYVFHFSHINGPLQWASLCASEQQKFTHVMWMLFAIQLAHKFFKTCNQFWCLNHVPLLGLFECWSVGLVYGVKTGINYTIDIVIERDQTTVVPSLVRH